MLAIIVESSLFVVLVAAIAALFLFVLLSFTPLGVRLRQTWNRRRIERAAELVCPVHGPHDERELVRLASGERICPDCFTEAVHGKLD
jgi:hypothetical protein